MTMSKLPNTGEAVIIDLGEANDIHPRNKQNVGQAAGSLGLGERLRRQGSVPEPDVQGAWKSIDKRIQVTFDHVGAGLEDVRLRRRPRLRRRRRRQEVALGRAAQITGTEPVIVSSPEVKNAGRRPLRLGRQPGLQSPQHRSGLPVTPFRTDDWPGVTVDAK